MGLAKPSKGQWISLPHLYIFSCQPLKPMKSCILRDLIANCSYPGLFPTHMSFFDRVVIVLLFFSFIRVDAVTFLLNRNFITFLGKGQARIIWEFFWYTLSLRVEPGEPELNTLTPAYLILKKLSQWIIYDTCLPELNNIKGKGENGND